MKYKDEDIMVLEYIFKKIKNKNIEQGTHPEEPLNIKMSSDLDENERNLKSLFSVSNDFKIKHFTFKGLNGTSERAFIAFADGLVDSDLLSDGIIKPLMMHKGDKYLHVEDSKKSRIETINETMVSVGETETSNEFEKALHAVLNGDCVLFIDNSSEFSIIGCKGFEKRSIEQPSYEVSMRGPRESFNENLRTNTSLLRRRLKNTDLIFEHAVVGRKTNTNIAITYVKGLADEKLINEVRRRISYINTDMILESGYIEQYIEDSPFSLFSTTGITERPDVLAAKLLEGRVAIMVDGTPFVLTVPYLFIEAFQNPEDYYDRSLYTSIVRVFRYMAFFLSVFVPGLYVALVSFHQELIPTRLLFNMASAREGVPFNAFAEIAAFLLVFELLKEAGIHMPKNVGQTISIVGGLVMGDAAIKAGILGAPVVIIIAFTAVSSFVVPSIGNEITMLRWIFLILGSVLGGFGISIGIIGLLIHISGVQSFGYSFFSPFFPVEPEDIKDTIVRVPLWSMHRRPANMAKKDSVRENSPIPPNYEE